MPDELEKPRFQIVYLHPGECFECSRAEKERYTIQISSIESEEHRWVAKGKGRIRTRCRRCRRMYEAIMHSIPIECATFPCPQCCVSQELSYQIKAIHVGEEAFEFEVIIECVKCRKKKSFTKAIKRILEIIKIEVKSTGISIKNS